MGVSPLKTDDEKEDCPSTIVFKTIVVEKRLKYTKLHSYYK